VSSNEELIKLANMKMPFGKYKGYFLVHLPEPYLVWFKLGEQLTIIHEIKMNGLEGLLYPLIKK
jgi:hypothetical protein